MRDAEYWQSRCRRAEGLLAKARKGIRVSYQRAAVMRVLGDMKPGEWLSTARLTLAMASGRKRRGIMFLQSRRSAPPAGRRWRA